VNLSAADKTCPIDGIKKGIFLMPEATDGHGHHHQHSQPGHNKGPKKPVKLRRIFHLSWSALLLVGVIIVFFVFGSFSFAASMEENDSFCASRHTQPESDYYGRSQANNPIDLASFHTTKQTRCIECHSGIGVTGRASAIMLGARNAVAYFTRTAKQPAPLTVPVKNDNCVKCHASVYNSTDFNNHFHQLLPRWQAADPIHAASCVDCHSAHTTDGNTQTSILSQARIDQVCQSCHQILGGGG
jgi:predicted CXXCH cytochrome family protein